MITMAAMENIIIEVKIMREAATNLLITVLTATIPVITVYLIKFIQKKSEQLL